MLVLSRRSGDSVTLTLPDGSKIKVFVGALKDGRVRLGFQAAPTVKIARTELLDADKGDAA